MRESDPNYEEAVNELELRLVAAVVENALANVRASRGYKWGAALTVCVIEYLREHGYELGEERNDECELAGRMFRAARLAIKRELISARAEGRLPKLKRPGR